MTLASRIVILDKGSIQQVGTPHEVFNRPANLFVAAFIGMPSMNLLEGRVVLRDGRPLLAGPGFAWPLPPQTEVVPEGRELVAGLRPQALRPAAGAGLLQLQVDVVEYLGTESLLVGHLVGGSERVTAVLPGQPGDAARGTLALDFDPAELHLFDKATGRRVGA